MTFPVFGRCLAVPVRSIISPVPSQTLMVNPLRNPFTKIHIVYGNQLSSCREIVDCDYAAISCTFRRRQSAQRLFCCYRACWSRRAASARHRNRELSLSQRYLSIESKPATASTLTCSGCPAPQTLALSQVAWSAQPASVGSDRTYGAHNFPDSWSSRALYTLELSDYIFAFDAELFTEAAHENEPRLRCA